MVETVTISKKEYEALIKQVNWLSCLENAGVDNWDGIDYAYEIFRDEYPEYHKEDEDL